MSDWNREQGLGERALRKMTDEDQDLRRELSAAKQMIARRDETIAQQAETIAELRDRLQRVRSALDTELHFPANRNLKGS